MAAVKELIRAEADGRISFGDYTLEAKTKKSDFEFEGNLYKVKTFKELTRLERNEMFVYESEPGSAVLEFDETEDTFAFSVE
ncbi:MAG: endosialidase, partial [Lachnospiraceae bacterium]|nr:endosialidase [Lachnospiraceae bacterium]